MKILQTPVRFYPFIGGVENYVYNLSRELVELGESISVVCANEPTAGQRESVKGFDVRRLSYPGKIANTNITPGLPLELLRSDFDIIHTHIPTPWSADWSCLAARAKGKPLVLTYHNDIVGLGLAGRVAWLYNSTCLPFLLRSAARIIITQPNYIVTSSQLKNYKNKVRAIPCGVDAERFKPSPSQTMSGDRSDDRSRTLFFLGSLDEFHRYKGLDILLKALSIVKKEMPDVKLKVGGAGGLLDSYKDMAEGLDLAKNVEFLGFIPDEALLEHYHQCCAFVLPSISAEQEGFGMVLLEAMASSKPVISTDIVGVADDVKRFDAGRIVKPGDEMALAETIPEILSDEEQAEEMGRRGRRLVEEKYTWKKVAKDVLEIYREVL
jgi:glycosyltransferase involved in cell wall biosynthesis